MPYIKQAEREALQPILNAVKGVELYAYSAGCYNYLITKILLTMEPECYNDYNEIIGILENVKLEMYRRMVAPYEDEKIKKNGDVY